MLVFLYLFFFFFSNVCFLLSIQKVLRSTFDGLHFMLMIIEKFPIKHLKIHVFHYSSTIYYTSVSLRAKEIIGYFISCWNYSTKINLRYSHGSYVYLWIVWFPAQMESFLCFYLQKVLWILGHILQLIHFTELLGQLMGNHAHLQTLLMWWAFQFISVKFNITSEVWFTQLVNLCNS